MFDIRWIPGTDILVAECRGFWTIEVHKDFHAALLRVIGDDPSKTFAFLYDAGEQLVQASEVVAAQARLAGALVTLGARRIAVVTQSALLRMQAARANLPGVLATFEDTESALAWISA